MKTLGIGAVGTAVGGGLARLSGLPLAVVFGGLVLVAVMTVWLIYRLARRVLFAPDDTPATRLERLLRVVLGRPDSAGDAVVNPQAVGGSSSTQ